MHSLTALDACLSQALHGLAPVPAEALPLSAACSHVLAVDLVLPADMPPRDEALRAGFAVSALDLTGASAAVPVPLGSSLHVLPGDPLPPGADAVLPEDGVEGADGLREAIRPVGPGEGLRRAGHDGRAGAVIARAGTRLHARQCLAASLAGIERCAVRRPRVAIALPDPRVVAFAAAWATSLGAELSGDAPHLILRPADDARPRLALAPGETAWLGREGGALVLSVPRRVDGMVAACLALGLPAMAALAGAGCVTEAGPLLRKAASALGLSDLVLLTSEGTGWRPAPPGSVTLAALAAAHAFAVLPPDSEGLAEGATLSATPLLAPFG
jgi:molybdopterin biosynthesis enzyme